jgi:hypothetical protein
MGKVFDTDSCIKIDKTTMMVRIHLKQVNHHRLQ